LRFSSGGLFPSLASDDDHRTSLSFSRDHSGPSFDNRMDTSETPLFSSESGNGFGFQYPQAVASASESVTGESGFDWFGFESEQKQNERKKAYAKETWPGKGKGGLGALSDSF